MKSVLNIHWKDWCWSSSSSTLATWWKELTHLKRPCCWERLKAGGEGDDRGWDGWMASLTQWTWVWASSGSWCWTGRPGVLQSMGSRRVGHDWATELNGDPAQDLTVCVINTSEKSYVKEPVLICLTYCTSHTLAWCPCLEACLLTAQRISVP